MSIPSHATPEETRRFAESISPEHSKSAFRRLGRTGLSVSALGFGTYRCHAEVEMHREALEAALQMGCNLVDTAANYGDGMAEVLVGEVLNRAIVWDAAPRERFVVVSKVGYIQGENLEMVRGRETGSEGFPEVVKYHDKLWHCIHPSFVEDQLTRSLSRMHLDTLDACLLHNPEYFLMWAEGQGMEREMAEKQFYHRLRRAFAKMEQLVAEGLMSWYGISSNSLPLPADHPHHVSLAKVWSAYCDACLQSGITPEAGHFALIQLPYNLLETGAANLANNSYEGERLSVLDLAERLDLGVLTNRPLNAIRENGLLRLASYGADPETDHERLLADALEALASAEDDLVSYVALSNLPLDTEGETLREFLQMGVHLRRLRGSRIDVSTFREVVDQQLGPLLIYGRDILSQKSPNADSVEVARMIDRYFECFQNAANAMLHVFDSENLQQIEGLYREFDHRHPGWSDYSIAQKTVLSTLNITGIDAVLVGMRQPEYVEALMPLLSVER